MAKENSNVFVPQQFVNPANPQIHRSQTAIEILEDVDGPIDGFCSGIGTGGTITGIIIEHFFEIINLIKTLFH